MLNDRDPTPLQFHLAEIHYLRREIEYRSLDQSLIERNTIISLGAIYAGLATLDASKIDPTLLSWSSMFWIIPVLISCHGHARYFDHHRAIMRLGDYIATCEKLLDPVYAGWECRFQPEKRNSERHVSDTSLSKLGQRKPVVYHNSKFYINARAFLKQRANIWLNRNWIMINIFWYGLPLITILIAMWRLMAPDDVVQKTSYSILG
jgi:hypothetical protein